MSVFLMGAYDKKSGRWRTVAKCGNGHDDRTLDKINKELSVTKISKVNQILLLLSGLLLITTFALSMYDDKLLLTAAGNFFLKFQ